MAKNRISTWLALIVAAIGLGLMAILGLWAYKGVTAPSCTRTRSRCDP